MFFGAFSPRSTEWLSDTSSLNRLQKAIRWNEGNFHKIDYHLFSGGFFVDSRLPLTLSDCLHIDTDNELMVLMHGSLYNRHELYRDGETTDSELPDPALVARLFLAKGPNMANRLNGDFSIIIYQARQNTLYVFRDHLGNVPIVYTAIEQAFYFSTDTLALCRTVKGNNRINPDPLIATYKPTDSTLTPNKDVLTLKPGHWLRVANESATVQKYWEPEQIKTDNTLSREQILADLKALLDDAVQIRADPRFRAGTHLSGGLDSSLVAVMARKHYADQTPFYGYSWTPGNALLAEGELDERDLIRQIGDMADIKPAFSHVEPRDLIESTKNSLHNFFYFREETVLTLAKAHKTNLLFSGWGGDEFLSIGSIGVDSDLVFGGDWNAFFRKNPITDPKKIVKYLIFRVILPAIGYIRPSIKKAYQARNMYFIKKEYKTFHRKTFRAFNCYRSRREFHLSMLYTYHISERTGPWCVTGYKNGVLYRYPLLDKRIVEYMLKVPSRMLVKDSIYTRIIPREISAGLLPETVRWRLGKSDPAAFSMASQQQKEWALLVIDEVAAFEANPDLYFIDFKLLQEAVEAFRQGKYQGDETDLFGDIIMFKFLHEFTKSYREPIDDNTLSSTLL